MPSFFPKRGTVLEERLLHIENWLSRKSGNTPLTAAPGVTVQARRSGVVTPPAGGVITGGGGASPAILGGDVTGAPNNNTVAALQAVPLTVTGASQGDILAFSGTGFTNEQALVGNYTLTGHTTAPTLTVQSGSLTDVNPALLVDDANPNVLFWVHPRPDLDAGFHPATVGATGYQTSKPVALFTASDAATNTLPVGLSLGHATSGVPAAGLGIELDFTAQGPSGNQTLFGHMRAGYAGGATGSENGLMIWGTMMNGTRIDVCRFRATGMTPSGGVGGQFWCLADFLHSGPHLGFFNTTPVVQQTGASAAGIAAVTDANAKAAISALQTALANLGLVTSPP